ncbi:MAG: hypothetical protein LUG98_08610 [Tannerellaceae bacterium]|nr:hypothetical protein [Tannerellaceae bacterium]
MKQNRFNSPSHLLVFSLFVLLAVICLAGSWYNPLHLFNAGLCGVMSWGTYKSW